MINTTSERLKARNFFICRNLSFYGELKFIIYLSFGKELISFLSRANVRAFHENLNRIHTELTFIIPRRSRRDIVLASSVRPSVRPSVRIHISVPIGQI